MNEQPDLPWFPFWVSDFLASRSVRTMDPEQVGIYVLLLCHQWDGGPLPDDLNTLSMLCHGAETNAVRTVLERCFVSVDDLFVNERLEEVRKEQIEKRKQKVRAGMASGRARRKRNSTNKKEQRSNSVRTEYERVLNESESESESELPTVDIGRKTKLPKSWKPTEEHREQAAKSGLDLSSEAAQFRNHAEANGRTQVRWNAAFTNWLIKAEQFAKKNGNGRSRGYRDPAADTDWEAEAQRINRGA